jgi:hypothetical protein
MPLSWVELAASALGRQLPHDPGSVGARVNAVGPMQTQTARAAFLGLAARFPGTTRAEVVDAYEAGEVVRGSTIRGTVHTATASQYASLGAATRAGQRRRWQQLLGLAEGQVDDLWTSIEEFAREWRTTDELRGHLGRWLGEHGPGGEAPLGPNTPGHYLAFGNGSLVRRPAAGTTWEGQGRPVYRTFDAPEAATVRDAVRLHLQCHGPASRHDIAWWSGLPLTVVDAAVDDLGLVGEKGPDGRTYLDVGPSRPVTDEGVRLLPEFDALLCAYDPKARERFVSPGHHELLWNRGNGLMLSPLLVDGRITGWWRSAGTARRRPLEVAWFAGTRRPRKAELAEAVAAVEAVLDITVTEVDLHRA